MGIEDEVGTVLVGESVLRSHDGTCGRYHYCYFYWRWVRHIVVTVDLGLLLIGVGEVD